MGVAYDSNGLPYTTDDTDDMTGGGSYLPSLPDMYQTIFNKLGFGPKNPAIYPAPSIQQQYQQNYAQRGPVHNELTNRDYGIAYGKMPMRSMVRPPNLDQNYSVGTGGGPYDSGQYVDRHQGFFAGTGAGPNTAQQMPSQSEGFSAGTSGGPYDSGQYPSRYEGFHVGTGEGPYTPMAYPSTTSYRTGTGVGPFNPSRDPDMSVYSDNPRAVEKMNNAPTGSATSAIVPKASATTSTQAPKVPSKTQQTTKKDNQSDEFLNDDEEDMRPGSLGEAKKLFPNRPLQQAIYYTDPRTGNSNRLGVGADTSKLNPDYVARIWEPADMSLGEKAIRGAFETPGKNPITWSPHKADGGSIDSANKIAKEKGTPCHVGLITMAVGGRTDHLPMNVLEGSYVLPADIVSGLGEGNTLAGSKLISTMFSSGPFGVSAKAPQFARVTQPSLGEYNAMQNLFGINDVGSISTAQKADGGPVMSGNYRPVPIVAAGGEYVIHPDVVRKLGNGSMEKGHDYLDKFVVGVRKHLVKTLSKLPGPRRD